MIRVSKAATHGASIFYAVFTRSLRGDAYLDLHRAIEPRSAVRTVT